ncbi:MAG: hypothetical protein IKC19_09385 [Bacteroidales bacterium]|nr:hypothetical protein [Bacteroidales bacterium]
MKLRLDKIDVSSKVDEFAQYLEAADRIILSAKFGDGKTYFLNELKKNKNLSEKYEFFTVYPVNYSVANSEDVFEYIKRDIIHQMYERKELDKIDVGAFFKAVQSFVDITSVVSFLLSFVPGGGLYNNILERFTKAKEEYDKQKHTADKYLYLFKNQRGGLYEDDGYTELIKETLRWVKEDHGNDHKGKKTVLIIEDLDRLDPQHLFRIMNVLSAHIDDTSEPDKVSNKFGFDNIVLVMDYEATKNIFHHFYGIGANYEGYMSKFLACEPFRYSIRQLAEKSFVENIGRILGIEKSIVHMDNFIRRVSKLSIRDFNRVRQFDTANRLLRNTININGRKISMSMPVFSLVLIMIECRLIAKEIINDLTSSYGYDEMEYIKLIVPICFLAGQWPEYISLGEGTYQIGLEVEDGVIIGLNHRRVYNPNAKSISIYNIEGALRELLNGEFNEYINTSSIYLDQTE